MSGLRFSITNLLAAVSVIGIGIASLNPPTQFKAALVLVATTCILLTAVLAAVHPTGNMRSFWLGFALFGWFYFVVAFTPAFPVVRRRFERPLFGVREAFWTVRISVPESQNNQNLTGRDAYYDHDAAQLVSWPAWDSGFGDTVHCLANLLFALAGGIAGRLLSRTPKVQTLRHSAP